MAETVDQLLRGYVPQPEMRWRDEGGVHRSQARPRPGPRERMPGERFGGLVGGGLGSFGIDPARADRRGAGVETVGRAGAGPRGRSRGRRGTEGWPGDESRRRAGDPAVFRAGAIADRGPLERGTTAPEQRAREARELERQAEWRASANRAMTELMADQAEAEALGDEVSGVAPASAVDDSGTSRRAATAAEEEADVPTEARGEEELLIRLSERNGDAMQLQPMNVLGFGISRKRLEQAIKDLQLPVVVVREPDEADVVITLRSAYKQKSPLIREAEMRGIPIYVLKSNTVVQMQSILTSLYVLDTDPQDVAMRELEEAVSLVRTESKPVELSPQNAYLRKLQHRAAEAANLVSRSRGREPFRRVRVYPEKVRAFR